MMDTEDPRCPECGEPIGLTATYCMHCDADLSAEREAADSDDDGTWDRSAGGSGRTPGQSGGGGTGTRTDEQLQALMASDGLLDNTLTVVVGIIGGLFVGVLGTVVLLIISGSGLALLFGLIAWLGATAYLVRRRTVQEAVAKSGYAVALVLLLVPVIALSPVVSVDGGLGERGGLFVVLLLFVAIPAGIAAGVGWVATRLIPEDAAGSEG